MGITEIFLNYYQYFLRGTQTTVIVSLITVLLGTVLGCLIALLRLSRFRLFSGLAKLYISGIRGTPLLVQLYIVYYQLHFIPWPEGSILGVELARANSRLHEAKQQEAALTRQLQQQTQENQALESDLAKKDDEQFIKDLARDQLGLAEAGERIFYDVND